MPKIKFLTDYTVKAAGGATYKKGQVVEMTKESCDHYVNRQPPRAAYVDEKAVEEYAEELPSVSKRK